MDSEESIPPAFEAWRAGTTNRVVVPARRFPGSLTGLQIRALCWNFLTVYGDWEQSRNRVGVPWSYRPVRARIFKLLRSPRIEYQEPIPPG
jgi:hypothetical protein